jgi:hypothetical protein
VNKFSRVLISVVTQNQFCGYSTLINVGTVFEFTALFFERPVLGCLNSLPASSKKKPTNPSKLSLYCDA